MQNDKVKNYFDEDDIKLGTTKGEYVFLLDRSGSMSGSRMRTANEALLMFMKSLPEDSLFNIISFGTSHKFMFSESKPYEENLVEKVLSDISSFKASFGMTEIYTPLKKIYQKPLIPGY